ncbi:MAG: hypothetical protein KDD70_15495 [Bdellovibrionales bacterium]|nr:hypothetical protein [Bdellovibrionales bacterium]
MNQDKEHDGRECFTGPLAAGVNALNSIRAPRALKREILVADFSKSTRSSKSILHRRIPRFALAGAVVFLAPFLFTEPSVQRQVTLSEPVTIEEASEVISDFYINFSLVSELSSEELGSFEELL